MGGRKKDCAVDRRLAKSKMIAAAAADDAAALRLLFSREMIGMVELLYCTSMSTLHTIYFVRGVVACVDGLICGWQSYVGINSIICGFPYQHSRLAYTR